MKRPWVLAFAIACSRSGSPPPTKAQLPELVDRYQAAMQQLATAAGSGSCADKAAALAPVIAAQHSVFEQIAAVVKQPELRDELGKLVDTRGAAISTPEIAFKQAQHDCKDDAKFVAAFAAMPR